MLKFNSSQNLIQLCIIKDHPGLFDDLFCFFFGLCVFQFLFHAAVKSDKSPYYKTKYERIIKRRGKKRAIIAIARMILTAAYQMLSIGEVWNPIDLYKIDMPAPLREKQKEKAIKQAKKLLIAEGIITEEQLAS